MNREEQHYVAFGGFEKELEFASLYERQGFVRKVLGLVSAQLLVTCAVSALMMVWACDWRPDGLHWSELKAEANVRVVAPLAIVSMILSLAVVCLPLCVPNILRQFPINYALLAVFTLAESVVVGAICMVSDPALVLAAAGITAAVTLTMAVVAIYAPVDCTGTGMYLVAFTAVSILASSGIFVMQMVTGERYSFLKIVVTAMSILLFSAWLVYDLQLMLGGGRRRFQIDDYVLAAISIYIDMVNIFVQVLELLQQLQQNM